MFAIIAIELFDITGAYLNEQYSHTQPVYVWQPPRFDGSYTHPKKAGELKGNIYGTPPYTQPTSTNTLKSTANSNCDLIPPCSRNTPTKKASQSPLAWMIL